MKSVYFAFVFLLLSGCASGPRIDTSHPSVNFDNRAQFYLDLTMPFYGYNRPGVQISEGVRCEFWREGIGGMSD